MTWDLTPERSEGEDWPLDSKNESYRGLKNRVESLLGKIVLNQSESIMNQYESCLVHGFSLDSLGLTFSLP
jgi:hypothetical protein